MLQDIQLVVTKRNVFQEIHNDSSNIEQTTEESSEDCKGNLCSSGAGPRQSILNLKENEDNSGLYFDITRGNSLEFNDEAENDLNSLTNNQAEENEENLVKVKVEREMTAFARVVITTLFSFSIAFFRSAYSFDDI